MTNRDALLSAAISQPADNVSRLVYADHIEEFGGTDQEHARAEWVRLTCGHGRVKADRSSGRPLRLPGEPAWLRENAPRLWPRLMSLGTRDRSANLLALRTGQVVLRVYPASPNAVVTPSAVVFLTADRGLTLGVGLTTACAARVAPVALGDEPHATIRLTDVPNGWSARFAGNRPLVGFSRDMFETKLLGGVWDLLTGWVYEDEYGGSQRCRWYGSQAEGEEAVSRALTVWARREYRAAVAHGSTTTCQGTRPRGKILRGSSSHFIIKP